MSDEIQSIAESEVRFLRDKIYGHTSDKGWDGCKDNWMKPENVQWLKEQRQNKRLKETETL